jgi:putative ABC transport system substrate-binding protein
MDGRRQPSHRCVTRSVVILNADNPAAAGFLGAVEAAAPSLGIQVAPVVLRGASDPERAVMERAVGAFAREPNGGMIVLPDFVMVAIRHSIIALAAQNRLPTVYPFRYFATSGGLMSYGVDQIEQSRQAASYVDRILKGAKPGDLPVQAPTKFETVINLQTAKALGLTVADNLLARADEVIE